MSAEGHCTAGTGTEEDKANRVTQAGFCDLAHTGVASRFLAIKFDIRAGAQSVHYERIRHGRRDKVTM
jgi:hypothetical protein